MNAQIFKEVDKFGRYPQRGNKLDTKEAREEDALRQRIDRQWAQLSEQTQAKLQALKHSAGQPVDVDADILGKIERMKTSTWWSGLRAPLQEIFHNHVMGTLRTSSKSDVIVEDTPGGRLETDTFARGVKEIVYTCSRTNTCTRWNSVLAIRAIS